MLEFAEDPGRGGWRRHGGGVAAATLGAGGELEARLEAKEETAAKLVEAVVRDLVA